MKQAVSPKRFAELDPAMSEVFIADPYADQEIFNLYLAKVRPRVKIRLLTKMPSSALKMKVFKA